MYNLYRHRPVTVNVFSMFNQQRMLGLTQYSIRSKSKIPFYFKKNRKAKYFKWKKYPCVPDFMSTSKRDPFDYTLQTKEEVRKQLLLNCNFPIEVGKIMDKNFGKPVESDKHGQDMIGEQVKIRFDMNEWPLSSLQKERLIFLLGPRYRDRPHVRFTVKQYDTFEKNVQRAHEVIKEMVLESLRAPNIDVRALRDPYYKERLKRKLGRT